MKELILIVVSLTLCYATYTVQVNTPLKSYLTDPLPDTSYDSIIDFVIYKDNARAPDGTPYRLTSKPLRCGGDHIFNTYRVLTWGNGAFSFAIDLKANTLPMGGCEVRLFVGNNTQSTFITRLTDQIRPAYLGDYDLIVHHDFILHRLNLSTPIFNKKYFLSVKYKGKQYKQVMPFHFVMHPSTICLDSLHDVTKKTLYTDSDGCFSQELISNDYHAFPPTGCELEAVLGHKGSNGVQRSRTTLLVRGL